MMQEFYSGQKKSMPPPLKKKRCLHFQLNVDYIYFTFLTYPNLQLGHSPNSHSTKTSLTYN